MKGKEYIPGIFLPLSVLLVVSILMPFRPVCGQQGVTNTADDITALHQEKFTIFTDRNLYIVGEKILFSVFNLSDSALKEIEWSKVLYLELVSTDHESVIQEKFRLRKENTRGYLDIPQSILTGNYYLRAYTRWMRNGSPERYAYARLKIVNPYQSEVSNGGRETLSDSLERISFHPIPGNGEAILIKTDERNYGPRSKVQLNYSINGVERSKLAGLCLTVVREGAVDTIPGLEYPMDVTPSYGRDAGFHIPETRGMAVTGEVVEKQGNRAVPNARVQLSVLGDEPDYFGYLTGKDGRFYIPLPDYTGLKDFYISAETGITTDFEILIDKDFSGDFLDYKTAPFDLSPGERSLAEEMMLNVQVQKAYGRDTPSPDSLIAGQGNAFSFYGKPGMTLRRDEYVKLPSLEEFIFELVPDVTVGRTGGSKELKFFGGYSDLSIYRPLVLLDHVAISDLSAILAVSPEKISYMDVINASYIRGSINYGGIISMFSSKQNLAGVDLPGYAYFFGLKTLASQKKVSFPSYENDKGNRRKPDFRNTLMWAPDLAAEGESNADLHFYTTDKRGKYLIYIRGVTVEGILVSGTAVIYVE